MDLLWQKITEWLKEVLISGITDNLTGMFDATNQKVAEISAQVGTTPQAWNGGIFNMIHHLSESVIVPIAGAVLAFVMTLELMQLITEKNNMNEKKFFANETYKELYLKSELPEPPVFADSIAVGFNDWLSQFAELSGLIEDLNSVFDVADSRLILDLASYMISRESAVMQHFPAWAREHMIFSEEIRNDTQIGKFLKNDVTVSKINSYVVKVY